ncbi:MAG TPA: aldo/keto reductase family oxidoreductase [Clostridiales bacterium]|nr:aldo/keto reductase family oxidoreductase [Clostridiales bacterium]
MNKVNLGTTELQVSQIALGCMRFGLKEEQEVEALIEKAVELGINFVDHADIYQWGKNSEEMFGAALKKKPSLREKLYVQTKCGICRGYYDFSAEHIIESAESSLRKMNLDTIDVLALHRPDALIEPEEVAKAFESLKSSGKVKHFGVSNMNPLQMQLIEKYTGEKLMVNQVEFSVVHSGLVDAGIFVNMKEAEGQMRDGGLLDYARLNNITLQAWSVLQISLREGTFIDKEEYQPLNDKLQELADLYGVTKNAVAIAWILRHPAKIQAIVGTTSLKHLEELCKACEVTLTRPQWYELYLSAGHKLP